MSKRRLPSKPQDRVPVTDSQLNDLLKHAPTKLSSGKRDKLKVRIETAIADALRYRRDHAQLMTTKQLQSCFETLRRHLRSARVLLQDNRDLMARLNIEGDIRAANPDVGFELVFDDDPVKDLYVRGRRLVALSLEGLVLLDTLSAEAQIRLDGQRNEKSRSSNNEQPHLNFYASVLVLIFKDFFGSKKRLIALSYNEVTGMGSPLIEFVRAGFRLIGASAEGNRVKQRLISVRKTTEATRFPVCM